MKRKGKTPVTIWFDDKDIKIVNKLAKSEDASRSWFIRRCIKEWIEDKADKLWVKR